ncbi:MAG: hypothetical protein ABIY40_03305 [Rhodanobacteraceae bacterium]|nr:hypothetical protein [Pseudomonadota bacterium]
MHIALALPDVVVAAGACAVGIGAGVIVEVFACDLCDEDGAVVVVVVVVEDTAEPLSFQLCTP